MTGTLSMQGIIRRKDGNRITGSCSRIRSASSQPIVLYISALAEGNRTPFDLPEAESELVAGFATEYSGMRYLLFFMAEWGNMFIAGALITTLYLGGWQAPRLTNSPVVMNVLQVLSFNVKVLFLVFASMWMRGTLPRVRIDQMMSLCWKFFVPIAFVNMIGTAVWVAIWPDGNPVAGYVMFALGVAIAVLFIQRVMYYLKRSRMEMYCIRRSERAILSERSERGRAARTMGAATEYFRNIKDAVVTVFDGMAVTASHLHPPPVHDPVPRSHAGARAGHAAVPLSRDPRRRSGDLHGMPRLRARMPDRLHRDRLREERADSAS